MSPTESEIKIQCLRMAREYYPDKDVLATIEIAAMFWQFISKDIYVKQGRFVDYSIRQTMYHKDLDL